MSILIGFAGRAGCGKDTAANYLAREMGFKTMAFAAPLKKTAAALFGLPEGYFHDRDLKERPLEDWDGLSPRHMLQLLGTEAVRNTFGTDFWIKRWMNEYRGLALCCDVAVTDVRFNNEAQAIRDLGGTIVHIVRVDPNDLDDKALAHASEGGVSMSLADYVINNEGSLNDLYDKLDSMMGRKGGRA